MSTIENQVRIVIAETLQCTPQEIVDDMSMKETEAWDSLTHMELVAAIETKFSIQLSFDEIITMITVTGIQKIVAAKVKGI